MSGLNTPVEGTTLLRALDAEENDMSGVESEPEELGIEEEDEEESDEESNSSDEDDEDDEAMAQPVKTMLNEAVNEIKNKTYKFSSSSGRAAFFEKYGEYIKQKTEDEHLNILHILLTKAHNIPVKTLESPIKQIVKKYPKLLLEHDEVKQTPLYSAIASSSLARLTEIMLENCKHREKALAKVCREKQENVLHLAMGSRHLSGAVKLRIIQWADQEAVCAKDHKKFTPLHRAVEFKRSSEEQLKVVRKLIAKNDTAFTDLAETPELRSVYQWAEFTKDNYSPARSSKSSSSSSSSRKVRERPSTTDRHSEIRHQSKDNDRKEKEQDPKARQKNEDEQRKELETRRKKENARNTSVKYRGHTDLPPSREAGASASASAPAAAPSAGFADHRSKSLVRRSTVTFAEETGKEPSERDARQREDRKARKSEDAARDAEEQRRKLEEWASKIRMELKLHCMRTRTPDETQRFLYGKNKDGKQICFEYFGGPTAVKAADFRASFKHVQFDEVLQYVAFPRLEVMPKPPIETPRPGAQEEDFAADRLGKGRTDMIYFFNWLRNKKVKRVLRVIVQDAGYQGDACHSDEAIEKALEGFQVESLDWQKPDLDPETICTVSTELRELTLHWSGNNAVLRGWGEPDGLQKLKKLRKIHMHIHRDLESVERSSFYFNRFCERINGRMPGTQADKQETINENESTVEGKLSLQIPNGHDDVSDAGNKEENGDESPQPVAPPKEIKIRTDLERKQIEVIPYDSEIMKDAAATPSKLTSQTQDKTQFTSHRWLDTTDKFADMIQSLWMHTENRNRGQPLLKPVVVALIDDGVDMYHKSLQGKISDGVTFDSSDDNRVKPYWVSERGHGTIMADMICRVCPMVKIIAIRLETSSSPVGKASIVVKSAAQAIEVAAEKGAHIISMSWTVDPPTEAKDRDAFDAAVRNAVSKKILMFCSSSDGGHYSDTDYPSASARDSVFRIGAAQDDGLPYSWAGPIDKLDYIFPGVEVVQRNPRTAPGDLGNWKAETGSSIATALAAGLAATIMYCVKMGALYTQNNPGAQATGVSGADVELIKRHKHMKQAFDEVGDGRGNQSKFVEVWVLFEGAINDNRGASYEAKMTTIANLARNLVKRTHGWAGE